MRASIRDGLPEGDRLKDRAVHQPAAPENKRNSSMRQSSIRQGFRKALAQRTNMAWFAAVYDQAEGASARLLDRFFPPELPNKAGFQRKKHLYKKNAASSAPVRQRLAGDDGDVGAGLQADRQVLLVSEVLRRTCRYVGVDTAYRPPRAELRLHQAATSHTPCEDRG